MNSKIKILVISLFLVFGAILLSGAGCSNKEATDNTGNNQNALNNALPGMPTGEGEEEGVKDIYGSAKEAAVPDALASELKSIFNEAYGAVKFTGLLRNPAGGVGTYVYVWKNMTTAEKLESAFTNGGYSIEVPGDALIVKKGNLVLSVNEEMESQEIGVLGYYETE